jgi:hypothetical protein
VRLGVGKLMFLLRSVENQIEVYIVLHTTSLLGFSGMYAETLENATRTLITPDGRYNHL